MIRKESNNEIAIEIQNLTKYYDDTCMAVTNLSLSIPKGTIFALLGPNGAGKTTTISILTTLSKQSSGDVFIDGLNTKYQPAKVREQIGVTYQELILDEQLTGYQVLDYHGKFYGMSRSQRTQKILELLDLVDLSKDKNKKCGKYSGGMKRRLELIRSLLTSPSILFLDEPTLGLDPVGRTQIWGYIKTLKEKGDITILLTTHYLDEAQRLADSVGIMDKGRLITMGNPAKMIEELGSDMITILGSGETRTLKSEIESLPYIESINISNNNIQLGVESSSKHLAEIVGILSNTNYRVDDISVTKPDLGDVFFKYTGHVIKDEEKK